MLTQIFDKFSDCAGLRANLDKTQAVWFVSEYGCGIEYLPHRSLLWNNSENLMSWVLNSTSVAQIRLLTISMQI